MFSLSSLCDGMKYGVEDGALEEIFVRGVVYTILAIVCWRVGIGGAAKWLGGPGLGGLVQACTDGVVSLLWVVVIGWLALISLSSGW